MIEFEFDEAKNLTKPKADLIWVSTELIFVKLKRFGKILIC